MVRLSGAALLEKKLAVAREKQAVADAKLAAELAEVRQWEETALRRRVRPQRVRIPARVLRWQEAWEICVTYGLPYDGGTWAVIERGDGYSVAR